MSTTVDVARERLEAAGWTAGDAALPLPDGTTAWYVVLGRGSGRSRRTLWARGFTREDAWDEAERLAAKQP